MHTFEQWQQRADTQRIPSQAIIGGQSCDAVSGATFPCVSPIDGRVLAEVADCGAEDIEAAVASARQTFDNGSWSQRPPAERKRVLQQFARLIELHREELALLETLDMGKPIADALDVDVTDAVDCISWNAEAIDKLYGEIAPTSANALGLITREPLGVIAAIVPWNFPMAMACWKLGPALATGNSVILKPSEKSPLTAIRLGELALEAGLPAGVLNVVPGFGKTAGEPLAQHQQVDGLVFTGSTGVGKHLLSVGALSNMKRTFVECGGKSANIIFADVEDLPAVAEAAAMAIFFNQGEVCSAGSRLLVEDSIADEFLELLVESAKGIALGNPLDPDTQMGAIVDDQQQSTVLDFVQSGIDEGGRLLLGGKATSPVEGGCYIEPTVFDQVTPAMRIVSEEIFGPVLSCLRFTSEQDAIALANDSIYGLGAGVWSSNINRCHRVARQLRAGSVWVNCYDTGDMTVPFGGYKQSGTGRDKSLHALEKYTELKTTWIELQD